MDSTGNRLSWAATLGRVALDRGEVPGQDVAGGPVEARLSTIRSNYGLPAGRWVTLEVLLRLGTGVPRSQMAPIDATFHDAARKAIDYDIVQVGATNNRSGEDRSLWIDTVDRHVESRAAPPPTSM